MKSCILKNNLGIYHIYSKNKCIFVSTYKNNSFSNSELIAENALNNFSVLKSDINNNIAILYQDFNNNIFLKYNNKEARKVFSSTTSPQSFHIDGIISNNNLKLIYSKENFNHSYLTEQHLLPSKQWSNPIILDNYLKKNNFTKLLPIKNNYILFYIKKAPEYQIGYREISKENISSFKLIYSSLNEIIDYCVAFTENVIHIVSIIKSNRSYSLVYIKKDSSGISKEKTLYIGYLKLCHISIENSKINIIFSTNNSNKIISSYDMGTSFKKITNLENNILQKNIFIDYSNQTEDKYVLSEILTDNLYNPKHCLLFNNY